MNFLVSSAGRRGALVRLIQQTVRPLGGHVFAVDAQPWSAACRLADGWKQVQRCNEPGFVEEMLDYCSNNDIRFVIPTIDTELPVYAAARDQFADRGIHVVVSGPMAIDIACDKEATHRFLVSNGLPTVQHFRDPRSTGDGLPFPLIVKPRQGSSSVGVHVVHDQEELNFYFDRVSNPVVQSCAIGKEYTVNFFVNRAGRCVIAVPHWRMETRAGEVSKCVTVRHDGLMKLAEVVAEKLPNVWGPMCFQAFVDASDRIQIIELNARFGGGYPIAHHAGANFVELLIRDTVGRAPAAPVGDWQHGILMTRWDDAVFANDATTGARAA